MIVQSALTTLLAPYPLRPTTASIVIVVPTLTGIVVPETYGVLPFAQVPFVVPKPGAVPLVV